MKRIINLLLVIAIVAGLPIHNSAAQERRPKVEITSPFRPEPLRPPPSRTDHTASRALALRVYDIQRWMDRTEAPPTLSPGRLGTFALGGDLRLQNVQYTIESSALVIVAEKLRIGANVTIDASTHRTSGSAGKVILLATEIICEPGGALRVVANGLGVSTNGGQVLVGGESQPIVAAGALPPCITATANGAPAKTAVVRDHRPSSGAGGGGVGVSTAPPVIRDHRRRAATSGPTPPPYQPTAPPRVITQTYPAGTPGRIVSTRDIRAITQSEGLAQSAWSMWVVERLDSLRVEIYDASRRGDRQRLVSLFREYEEFNPSAQMISADMRDRYLTVVADLQAYRASALPALWVEELSVRPGGVPQPVTAFTEGATFKTSLAPTHALASRATIDGRSVLGTIDYRSERPDELAIEAEWELSVDPWMELLAVEQLRKRGQTLDGVFGGWALEAKPMQEMAVRSATATLLPGGRRLRMRVVADAARANLVFWRLLNSAGLPWTVDWKFIEPGTGRVVNGTWAGPPLTLARQRHPQVVLEDGHLVNKGPHAVVVNYLRKKDGFFVALNPAIRIAAGERVAVTTRGVAEIPPEAVESLFNPETFGTDFHVLNGEQVVDRVVVKNLLPTSDDERGVFDRVEITVKTGVEGDTATGVATAGPFVLSATGTRAGEISIPFLRLARGDRQVTIEGRAYYAGGSYRTLKPTTFDTLAIAITPEMFQ